MPVPALVLGEPREHGKTETGVKTASVAVDITGGQAGKPSGGHKPRFSGSCFESDCVLPGLLWLIQYEGVCSSVSLQ